ncbi:MAG: undecaprenyldiphospho-muramoylpentapeptide beta-N-acetylglucosaminyltransferase [Gammaproteobacteria bacterium]
MRILIMAGGTGGHVYPGLAVAQSLRAQGVEVVWMGTRAGLEADVVTRAGINISFISVSGLRGKGWLSWLLAPTKLTVAFLQSLKLLMRLRPNAVLGMGGFVTGPGGFSAWLLDKPLIIHEQNAIAGLTNRLLAPLAKKALEGFPGSLKTRHALPTGNPVRAEIVAIAAPAQRLSGRNGPLRLLVLGGSLGAQIFNEVVPKCLQNLDPAARPEVWHQAGVRNIDAARQHYKSAGLEARLVPFISDMAEAYAWADLVLCRAGALTVAELACAGVAAILVPYPHAVDDHQTHNARYLADAGAAVLVPQPDLTAAYLTGLLQEFSQARHRLLDMAQAARARAQPEATARVAALCMEAANGQA